MLGYHAELLKVADQLLARHSGQRGRLPAARIRRSISTSYYAVFHFLLEEAGKGLIGTSNGLLRPRRVLARTFTHTGIRKALDKVKGTNVDASVIEFMKGQVPRPVPWHHRGSLGISQAPSPMHNQSASTRITI